jgi:spore germination protein (amino acid permease)
MKEMPVQYQVSPYLVFFLIHAMQVGVGMLGFERIVAKFVGNDSWLSILLAGLSVNVIIWIMYKLVSGEQKDLIEIHRAIWGKWLGGLFSLFFLGYLFISGTVVLRTYIEVLQVWIFSNISTWIFAIVLLALAYYIVSGGFRVVGGMAFFGMVIPLFLVFTVFYPLGYADFRNLLPLFNHSPMEIIKGMEGALFSILGFEVFLIYYPFVKDGQKSQKFAHAGAFLTTVGYTYLMILSLAFFSKDQLSQSIWAYLSMIKIIEFSFIERFEYILISLWAFVILPNFVVNFWAASRGLKVLFKAKQKYFLCILLIAALLLVNWMDDREKVNMMNTMVGKIGAAFIYGYLPLLLLLQTIKQKMRKQA